jgi:urate oxidase/2-oxo-4-hydroxy-4-carboxy-5-ureidoimidazoline decarboxylase
VSGSVAHVSYGKLHVPIQRVGVPPLLGLAAIPESPVRALDAELIAAEVDVEVLGQGLRAAFTDGDNTGLVATDTMKNVILRSALEIDERTPEGYLWALGRRFLRAYPSMEELRLALVEKPFTAARIGAGGERSSRLFRLEGADHGQAEVELGLDGEELVLRAARGGHLGMRLLKTTGSSFRAFARDEETTLPERIDRPLFIHCDIRWRYGDPADALGRAPARYVAAAQVRDVALTVFHEFVSESIQHLVHEIGGRLLERFPALAEVSFAAENHTFDPVPGTPPAATQAAERRGYTTAFPAWGLITLIMKR